MNLPLLVQVWGYGSSKNRTGFEAGIGYDLQSYHLPTINDLLVSVTFLIYTEGVINIKHAG
jgi:hypothetical protein